MKNSPLATVLLTVLVFSAVASAVLCMLDIKYTRELRSLQAQVNQINNNINLMNALVSETVEYAKTHPDIDSTLESIGLKPKTAPATTGKSNSK